MRATQAKSYQNVFLRRSQGEGSIPMRDNARHHWTGKLLHTGNDHDDTIDFQLSPQFASNEVSYFIGLLFTRGSRATAYAKITATLVAPHHDI